LLNWLITFYQRWVSPLFGEKCRYYPSCSHYMKQQLRFRPWYQALWLGSLRILRCNKLFVGGIDYPKVPCPVKSLLFYSAPKKIAYWFVPDKEGTCFLIETLRSSR